MEEKKGIQHALKFLAECDYDCQSASPEMIGKKLSITMEEVTQLLQKLRAAEFIEPDTLALTGEGREYALHVLKAHRLYETYLARTSGHPESVWHQLADEKEHDLTREDVKQLSEELGHPRFDPHGDPIPTSAGEMPEKSGKILLEYPAGWVGRVVHIEDEPAELYSRITEAGITTDTVLRIVDKGTGTMTLQIEGETFRFPDEVVAQITAHELKAGEKFDESVVRLSRLEVGEKAEVVGMSALVRGLERNRLLDLGVVPGTVTQAELRNPSGSPVGYRIRGACIALRKEQAERIRIRRVRQ
jgi:DtxR family transcriptional regulator, Mn-dependent transcriptional regulator